MTQHTATATGWTAPTVASPVADGVVRIDSRSAAPQASVSRLTYWRRRLTVLAGVVGLALLLVLLVGNPNAEAELANPVGGHVVVEPGDTLLEIAAQTAPAGMDVHDHLRDIRELNGFASSSVDAWTVVLLPAR